MIVYPSHTPHSTMSIHRPSTPFACRFTSLTDAMTSFCGRTCQESFGAWKAGHETSQPHKHGFIVCVIWWPYVGIPREKKVLSTEKWQWNMLDLSMEDFKRKISLLNRRLCLGYLSCVLNKVFRLGIQEQNQRHFWGITAKSSQFKVWYNAILCYIP